MRAIEHVLMTADAVGGVWTYALNLTHALAEHGIHVSVALLGPSPTSAQRAEAAHLRNLEIHERPGRLEWMEDPWLDVDATGEWLLRLEQQLDPDVVHLNGYAYGAWPWSAPTIVVGHSCVLSWWQAVHHQTAPPKWGEYARRVRDGLRGASLVVAPTRSMLAALQQHYGPLRAPTAIIPNGRAFTTLPQPKQPFLLAAGRLWDAAKNVDAVCAVAEEIDWPVYIAGAADAPASDASGAAASPCAAPRHLGSLPFAELAEYMARASIFVSPARYEPFGLAVLEAALAGDALVLGDIDSLREIWEDAAIFVATEDRRQLAWTLNRLIADDGRRAAMALRARARALQFDPRRMAAQYLHAYEELIVDGRPLSTFGALGLESR